MDLCDDQSETIAFLASARGRGAAGPTERIDTHAAIVFLTGVGGCMPAGGSKE